MSVFLTFLLLRLIAEPRSIGAGGAVLLLLGEMAGGAALGVAGGWVLAQSLKRLPIEAPLAPVLVVTGGLAVFGLAQLLGTSGFLATYVAAVIAGATRHCARQDVEHFFEGIAWLAQIVLFLMLGLLVTPEDLPPYLPGAIIGAALLILVARPVAVFACLLPFRFNLRETAFASWVGAARSGSDIPQHHPRIGRSAARRAAVCQHLHPGDRLSGPWPQPPVCSASAGRDELGAAPGRQPQAIA